MPHFYVRPGNVKNNLFSMDKEQAHYVAAVRRFNEGDEIMIFDGLGNSYKAQITKSSKESIEGKILSSSYKMPDFSINIYTAIPKGDRFEWLIEKAGELGIAAVFPINTKRSVNPLGSAFSKNKLERYEKISIAASSQCGRNDIMKVAEPLEFKKACQKAAADKAFINLLAWESANGTSTIGTSATVPLTGANIFIGPEGGFENDEVEFAKSLGIKTISLGENILRVETAAVVASVLIFNAFGAGGKR